MVDEQHGHQPVQQQMTGCSPREYQGENSMTNETSDDDAMKEHKCDECGHKIEVGLVGTLRSRVDCECGGIFHPLDSPFV